MNRRSTSVVLLALALGFVVGQLSGQAPAVSPAQAQDPARPVGRYQISVIRGAAYLVDTTSADVWVREYQSGRWASVGNPVTKTD